MTRVHTRTLALVFFSMVWPASLVLAQAPDLQPRFFHAADRCVACHNGIVLPGGEDISFGTDWAPTMMANCARDPYWRASVRRESLVHPTARAAIENECAACHMPMARYEAKAAGQQGEVFANLQGARAISPMGRLAIDGTSCAMCHQIQDTGFGQKSSFAAGFFVDTTTPFGKRRAFGPYKIDEGRQSLMRSSSRFIPSEGAHIRESELCATCHTLYTQALGPNGEAVGELPEQVPYLEWKHSAYPGAQSCQSCHMPAVDGEVPITGVMGQPRAEVARHVFRGGNFFMPRILNRNRFELNVAALPQDLDAAALATVEHLQTSAAAIAVESEEVKDGRLEARVAVQNLAGHKLPTAYPSRRAWVHFTVRDRFDRVVFESGALNPDGSISGNDNDASPDAFEPHYDRIEKPGQVQVYESILEGPDKKVTTVLLTAVRYVKDNRILPDGFDKATAVDDIAVRGEALEDGNFTGGSDRILYVVDLDGAQGPFEVEAELWYQPIAFRWAHNLEQQDAPETRRFISYYTSMSGESAVVLARRRAASKP